MKKNKKIRTTAEGIRVILDIFKDVHNLNNYAERFEDSCCNDCSDRECASCSCDYIEMPQCIMIQLLDHNKQHICSNWINNSSCPSEHYYWWDNPNCLASILSEHYDIDLHHITWGAGNAALAKTRYIRIFTRSTTDCGDEIMEISRGYELDLYSKTYSPFVKTLYYYGHHDSIVYDYVY